VERVENGTDLMINGNMKVNYILLVVMCLVLLGGTAYGFTGSGAGTLGDPFLITDCFLLNETHDDLSAAYALNNTIDCDVAPFNTGAGFFPIGDDIAGGGVDNFVGNFNGRGFYIVNLFIDFDRRYVGLFGYVESPAEIVNLNFMDINLSNIGINGSLGAVAGRMVCCKLENISVVGNSIINGPNTGGVVGQNFVGGTNIFANLTVFGNAGTVGGLFGFLGLGAGEVVKNARFVGSVTGTTKVGGIAGDFDTGASVGIIINASVDADVSGTNRVGGLIGDASREWRIFNSSVEGTVSGLNDVGGFIGQVENILGSTSVIDQSYSTADVTGDTNVGGFIGLQTLGVDITNSYAQGDVSAGTNVGGFVGSKTGTGTTITNAYATGDVTGSLRVGGFIGSETGTGSSTNVFSFGDVSSGGTSGGFSGDDTITVSNCFWLNKSSNPPGDSPTVTNCGLANAIIDPNFFIGDVFPANEPMASWPFFDIWSELFADFPVLTHQGIGTSITVVLPVNITDINGSINITFPVRWTTAIFANSSVNFGTTLSLGTIVGDPAFVKEHFILLASLPENTTFFYNVTSATPTTNETLGPFNFTTTTTIIIEVPGAAVSEIDLSGVAESIGLFDSMLRYLGVILVGSLLLIVFGITAWRTKSFTIRLFSWLFILLELIFLTGIVFITESGVSLQNILQTHFTSFLIVFAGMIFVGLLFYVLSVFGGLGQSFNENNIKWEGPNGKW